MDIKAFLLETKRFRFTQWQKGSKKIEELYDFNVKDPEAKNVICQVKYKSYMSDLREKLKQGFHPREITNKISFQI